MKTFLAISDQTTIHMGEMITGTMTTGCQHSIISCIDSPIFHLSFHSFWSQKHGISASYLSLNWDYSCRKDSVPVHLQLSIVHGTGQRSAQQWSLPFQWLVQMMSVLQQNDMHKLKNPILDFNEYYEMEKHQYQKTRFKPASRRLGTISLYRLKTSSNPLQNLSSG